jgi:drug/metabolite transporter (DMT)-like permease
MYVVSKVVLDVIPPFALVSVRLFLGIGALALLLGVRGGLRVGPRQVLSVLVVGLVGYGVSLGLQFVGTKLSTAANAALVTSASPAFILLFGALLLKEQVTAVGLRLFSWQPSARWRWSIPGRRGWAEMSFGATWRSWRQP